MWRTLYVLFAFTLIFPTALHGEETRTLSKNLEPLRPFLGKTWKGAFVDSTGKTTGSYDVSRWERALNGQAIRILHSLNKGQYGGETIVMWDEGKESLIHFYFTTAGFYTTGTMAFDGSTFSGHEYVTGEGGGITEVKSKGELLPDGRLHSTSYYLKDGEWIPGHEIFYVEDPSAEVIFN